MVNLTSLWCCRRFDRRLRSSLPGLYRAERCEKPHRGTTIQGETNLAHSNNRQYVFPLSVSWSLMSRLRVPPPLLASSWTPVSSKTRRSTSLSASKAASDQWGCSWWRMAHSRSFASTWWPSQTPHPTPSKCTECCAGKSTLTSSWEKPFPKASRCGGRDKTCGLLDCGERWLNELSPYCMLNCAFGNC